MLTLEEQFALVQQALTNTNNTGEAVAKELADLGVFYRRMWKMFQHSASFIRQRREAHYLEKHGKATEATHARGRAVVGRKYAQESYDYLRGVLFPEEDK